MAKKKSRVKKSRPSYQNELIHNEEVFKNVLKNVRPDMFVLMDLLDNTGVNPYVIFHVIRHMNNIGMGTKYGTVLISIEKGVVTFIRGEEATKLNEDVYKRVSHS